MIKQTWYIKVKGKRKCYLNNEKNEYGLIEASDNDWSGWEDSCEFTSFTKVRTFEKLAKLQGLKVEVINKKTHSNKTYEVEYEEPLNKGREKKIELCIDSSVAGHERFNHKTPLGAWKYALREINKRLEDFKDAVTHLEGYRTKAISEIYKLKKGK